MSPHRRSAVLLAGLGLLCLGLVGACAWAGGAPRELAAASRVWPSSATPRPLPVTAAAQPAREPPALRVLHHWDVRRARAYAAGSAALLRDLYLTGAGAGRADVRLLRDYRQRGFRVCGMRMQLLAVSVLSHGPGLWRLRVTDRLAHAVARRAGERVVLPRDGASTRVLTLRRGDDGRWRMAGVVSPGAPR